MPYSIVTKDGIRINNIPDDVDQNSDQLKQRVAEIRAQNQEKINLSSRLDSIDDTPREADLSGIVENSLEAALVGTGKGLTNIGRGAQRLFALASGDDQEAERLRQLGASEDAAFSQVEQEFPVSSFVGEVAGEVAGFPIGGIGKSLGQRALSSVVTGGAAGAASEAGSGGENIGTTGALGAAFGPVGEATGALIQRFGGPAVDAVANVFRSKGIDPNGLIVDGAPTKTGLQVMDALNLSEADFQAAFQNVGELAKAGRTADESFRIARAAEEGVDLTQGQASRNFGEQSAEDSLKSLEGIEGARARAFFTDQQKRLVEAKDSFTEKIGGELGLDRTGRGEAVRGALNEINSTEKLAISDLYKALKDVEGGSTRLNASGLLDLDEEIAREISPSDRILKGVNSIFEDFDLVEGAKKSKLNQGPLTFANAEAFRQRLNKLKPTDPADIAYVSQLKQGLDDLFAGAVEVLPENAPIQEAAQAARGRAAQRFRDFESKDIIEDLTSFKRGTQTARVPDEVVLDRILAGGNKKITNLKAVKRILTQNPSSQSMQAWREIQTQAVMDIFNRAVKETPEGVTISGSLLNSDIKKFGDPALKVLFSPEQLTQLKRLQSVIGDATIPVPRTTNPSGTGAKIVNILQRVVPNIGLVSKAATLLGSGAAEIRDEAQRKAILEGIENGASKAQRSNAILGLISAAGTRQSLLEEVERE